MKTAFFLLATLLTINATAQTDSSKILYEGTIITLELQEDLTSGKANVGDVIQFKTSEPVIVGDRVLVPAGTTASGQITIAERKKGLGKAGKLEFTIDYLNMPNGKNIKLTSEVKGKGKNKAGAAVAQAVLLTPLFLLKKGKNIKFDKGQIFKCFIENDTYL